LAQRTFLPGTPALDSSRSVADARAMDLTRIFLLANALLWLPYGVYCLAQPQMLAEAAGVAATSTTGSTELRAMYGGLQAAIGALALIAAFRLQLQRTALVTLAFLAAGLFSARACGALIDGGVSGYTAVALVLESSLTVASVALLRRRSVAA
jgi:hypothetical protein